MSPADRSSSHLSHCGVCEAELNYLNEAKVLTCYVCGKIDSGYIVCPSGHYLCDGCYDQDVKQVVLDVISTTSSVDPYEIVTLILDSGKVPMLGCGHAYIACGAILGALKNEGTIPIGSPDIREVFARTAKQAHGGYCGLTGVCGIAPALGGVVSLLLQAKCGTDHEQKQTMQAVTMVSQVITDLTGPSCCKAYVWGALRVMVSFINNTFGVILELGDEPSCSYGAEHPHGCRGRLCPYFPHEKDRV